MQSTVEKITTKNTARMALKSASFLLPGQLVWVVTLLGGFLRFYNYDKLSLWLDEGYTVQFSEQPWAIVLGLRGAYDTHPPLYYALVKLVALVVPQVSAGRILSIVAGTLTIILVYAIGSKILKPWAALLASLALALSPLHIWYSQEARQYAVAMLLVSVSYFALVSFYRTPQWRWALLYGAALLLSMYVDYSPLYAFVPQLFVFALILRVHKWKVIHLFASALLAIIGYLPWVPQMMASIPIGDPWRASYLGATQGRVLAATRAILGFAENRTYFFGSQTTPWELWPLVHDVLLLGVLVAFVLGIALMCQQLPLGAVSALSLTVGTILTAALVSQISPGFAERTVLYATLGWALIIGALACYRLPGWFGALRLVGLACVAFTFLLSLFTIFWRGDKQHWNDLATDTASAAASGKLILTYPGAVAETLISVYEPHALSGWHINLDSPDQLSVLSDGANKDKVNALWFAYLDIADIGDIRDRLSNLGYVRVLHNEYWRRLYLDMYIRSGVSLGTEIPINGEFQGEGVQAKGWQLPKDVEVSELRARPQKLAQVRAKSRLRCDWKMPIWILVP